MDGFKKRKLISENSQPVAQVLTLKLGLSEIHSVDADLTGGEELQPCPTL